MKKILLVFTALMLYPSISNANDCNFIMDQERMEIIINQMNKQSDDNKKLNIIKTYLQRLCFDTNQMLSIQQVFDSKETKDDFFLYSKDFITDLENYNQIKFK
ncbi:MAG: DUF4476 domain-containing protein [Flavobacteriales bacterium TMED191]|nr:MAG: DUF4476 domain-containing protein [Flavobacteriales bacterium TMED191]|tara:strand:+ start:3484 stop:3792 length:309 start_codon:yes stop_codon:yes gene_type:complete